MKKLLPILFLLVGLGGGIGAGIAMSPSGKTKDGDMDKSAAAEPKKAKEKATKTKSDKKDTSSKYEYLKMTKQFVIPVVKSDRIAALVTMSLSLETKPGVAETIYEFEPKLRDGFLQVLFDHANTGGFNGNFTESDNLDLVRKALLQVAKKDLGDDVLQVLIMSVNRQDT
ncbi:flagellar basal body-associated protein FliL [Ruegeria faecimaris]|uniref:flagellar basal body-associated protein FliL n=1 Tax=Ruegeria faecimaris TaxID=686389 RepID=UPI00232ED29D|nr:flagellar basal body-associated protein FliL [Ruegeria faecimaris]